MARWDYRRRDTAMLEARRLEGFELLRQGLRPSAVARRLGVSPSAVSGWKRRARGRGPASLRARPRSGRPARVGRGELSSLPTIIQRGPRSYGSSSERWTLAGIAHALQREWGVRYSRSAVWALLRTRGFRWTTPVPAAVTRGRPRRPPHAERGDWVAGTLVGAARAEP